MFVARRSSHNPILKPDRNHYWEATATFNLCPITGHDGFLYGVYRAISASDRLQNPDKRSVIGIGKSRDGINFEARRPFILPQEEWDAYGCEDPRIIHFEGKYYIFYTALSNYPFSAANIKIGVAVSKNLIKIDERHLITPANAKAMSLFPERINGKVTAILSVNTDAPPAKLAIVSANSMNDLWNFDFWQTWYEKIDEHSLELRRSDYDHVEAGAPPIKTDRGWLVIYSHIQNYFPGSGNRLIFGIEAVLLDLKDPKKIIGRTKGPIIAPSEPYELEGIAPNVVFPTGAVVKGDILSIYYGAADTTTCLVRLHLSDLLDTIAPGKTTPIEFKQSKKNPIIEPKQGSSFEEKATFNPAAIRLDGATHLLYRAMSNDNTSTIGYAKTIDGETIIERDEEPIYLPTADFERKNVPGGNSGCEDPRLSKIGNTIYMVYTSYDGTDPPRAAMTSISEENFLAKNWKWQKPFLLTIPGIDDKDACLLPEKINGKYFILHRVGDDICGDYLEALDGRQIHKCLRILGPRPNVWDSSKVGMAATPIKTKDGWLALYHGILKDHNTYRVGAMLLDLEDPTNVLVRTSEPLFEPIEEYETAGQVRNVVFPCGMVENDGELFIYYGGADKFVGAASIPLKKLLDVLRRATKL